MIPEVGIEGQKKLKQSKVLIVGIGGLGSPAALYLAAAGISLGILDFDFIDESNIQRQILYTTKDVGKRKTEVAKQKLLDLNPNIEIIVHNEKLNSGNAENIIKDYDVIIDGSDNFPTKYLVNDVCILLNKPFVYGSVHRFEGRVSTFNYKGGPCFRCIFSEAPKPGLVKSCEEDGVLGVIPGIIGSLQANEAIKIILGKETLSGRFLIFDGLDTEFKDLKFKKNPKCICISEKIELKQEFDQIEPAKLKELLEKNEVQLIDVREKSEWDICHIKGARLIPMKQIKKRLNELNKEKTIVLYCHHGRRSQRVLEFLKENGFEKLKNLSGGIASWAEKIEPEMTMY